MPGGGEDIENLTTGLAKLQTTSEETTSEGRGDEQPYRLDAYKFIYNVKARFEGNIDVFYSFLNNLLMWESGSKTMAQICHESTILFREHPDLLLEFAPFLAGFSQETLVRDAGMSMLLQPLNI